eukprot:g4499.t1
MVFQEDFFSLNFPGQPEIRTEPYKSEYGGTFPANVYEVREGDNLYSMKVVDFTHIEEIYKAQEGEVTVAGAHNFWFFDQLAAISYAARQFRIQATEIDYDAWHVIDGIEGHQLYLLNTDNSRSYVGIYRHDKRLYIMEARVPDGVPPQGIFQQSLHIIDAEGNRIRYREQAIAIGEAIQRLELKVGHIAASPVFRARDTAELAFGADQVEIDPWLIADDYIAGGYSAYISKLRQYLSTHPESGNTWLVGHVVPISMATASEVGRPNFPEGAAAVFKPQDNGYELVGILGRGWEDID